MSLCSRGDLLIIIRSVKYLKSCCILEPNWGNCHRLATIEAKISTTQSDLDILLQLQAAIYRGSTTEQSNK